MSKIVIISASVRNERKSDRAAQFIFNTLVEEGKHEVEIVDLLVLNFPIFHERLKFLKEPPKNLIEFSHTIQNADGVIIVSPEYNGSIPSSLKNAMDVLTSEWVMKPIGLCGVSGGAFGGSQMLSHLSFAFWKMGAWVAPASFQVPTVQNALDENGTPNDRENMIKRVNILLKKLEWCMEAKNRMKDYES